MHRSQMVTRMPRIVFSQDHIAYFMKIYKGRSRKKIAAMMNKKFGTKYTVEQIDNLVRSHGLRTDTKHSRDLFTSEEAKQVSEMMVGKRSDQIAKEIKKKFGKDLTTSQIRCWKKNHKVQSGYDARYRKGHIPANKGMQYPPGTHINSGNFGKGHIAANNVPIGTITVRSDGYVWKKIKDGHGNANWKQLASIVWEKKNGKVPPGMVIAYRDGNALNVSIDNLVLASRAQMAIINTHIGLTNDPEINDTIFATAKLRHAIAKKKRKEK